MTIWHLKDLVDNVDMRINTEKIKHISIPQYEGLTIENVLKFAANFPEAMSALPIDEKERLKLPRQYLANVVYTRVG